MLITGQDQSTSRESLFVKSVKIKQKGKDATIPPRALPGKSSELRGWPAIARFLSMPHSTAHRWAKEGMPIRREGRNVVANPEDLNQWLRRTSGEAAGVYVVTPGSDLLKDLRASVAAQKSDKNSPPQPENELRSKSLGKRASRASRKS
jgi:hypothetical protein